MRTHDAREELDYVHCRARLPRIRLAGNWPLNIRYVLAHVLRTGLMLAPALAGRRFAQLIARAMQNPRARQAGPR